MICFFLLTQHGSGGIYSVRRPYEGEKRADRIELCSGIELLNERDSIFNPVHFEI